MWAGVRGKARLELGDSAAGILKISDDEKCDPIAMPTHGHRFLEDLLYGSTITHVRRRASVPVLLASAAK
jgi:universal stress protein A